MLQKFPNIELRLDTTCCPSYYPSSLQNTARQNTPEVKVICPDRTLRTVTDGDNKRIKFKGWAQLSLFNPLSTLELSLHHIHAQWSWQFVLPAVIESCARSGHHLPRSVPPPTRSMRGVTAPWRRHRRAFSEICINVGDNHRKLAVQRGVELCHTIVRWQWSAQYSAVCSVQCAVCRVPCAVCSVQCAVCSV